MNLQLERETVFSDPRNLELTLATIFRPHNSYCVHVDHKSDILFRSTVSSLLECYRTRFPGSYIYPATVSHEVYWGHFSIVSAELSCIRDLLTNGRDWRYALDMAGSEVMLATNLDLVTKIRQNDGKKFASSFPMPEDFKRARVTVKRDFHDPAGLRELGPQDPPPHNISLYAGGKSWVLPRQFLTFLTLHPVAKDFLGTNNFN